MNYLKKINQMLLCLTFISAIFGHSAQAQMQPEPSYCDPKNFLSHEIQTSRVNPVFRLHAFQLGQVRLLGLAVGISLPSAVAQLALKNSTASETDGYCTWYFNKWNQQAERMFNWRFLNFPANEKAASEYVRVLANSFDTEKNNFLGCLEKHHYLAMGCNNMQHRGPSAFSMVLAFSGCSPESSVTIIEHLWGQNTIATQTRLAIAKAAYDLGTAHAGSRLRMQNYF